MIRELPSLHRSTYDKENIVVENKDQFNCTHVLEVRRN